MLPVYFYPWSRSWSISGLFWSDSELISNDENINITWTLISSDSVPIFFWKLVNIAKKHQLAYSKFGYLRKIICHPLSYSVQLLLIHSRSTSKPPFSAFLSSTKWSNKAKNFIFFKSWFSKVLLFWQLDKCYTVVGSFPLLTQKFE